MAISSKDTPSPGQFDNPKTQLTTSSKDLANSRMTDSLKPKPLGHQSDENTGGMNKFMRVLYCTGLADSINYKIIYEELKPFGDIERIKLVYKVSDYDGYVTFRNDSDALAAQESLVSGKLNFSGRPKLLRLQCDK